MILKSNYLFSAPAQASVNVLVNVVGSTKDLTEQEQLSDWMYIQLWGIFLYGMRTKRNGRAWTSQKWNQCKWDITRKGEQHSICRSMKYKRRQLHWQSMHGKYICLYNIQNSQTENPPFISHSLFTKKLPSCVYPVGFDLKTHTTVGGDDTTKPLRHCLWMYVLSSAYICMYVCMYAMTVDIHMNCNNKRS
jgi:hypothetical protein